MSNVHYAFSELLQQTLTLLNQESARCPWVYANVQPSPSAAITKKTLPPAAPLPEQIILNIPPQGVSDIGLISSSTAMPSSQFITPDHSRLSEREEIKPISETSSLNVVLKDISKFCPTISLRDAPLNPKDIETSCPDILLVDADLTPQERMFMRHLEKALKSKGFSTVFSQTPCQARFTISTSQDASFILDPLSSYLENPQKKAVLWKSLLRDLNV